MSPVVESAFTQLFSVGLLWISVHCAGMCGPLLVGLDVGGAARGLRAAQGAACVLAYQGGKALTYALLGAAAGALGAGLQGVLEAAGSVLALFAGALMFAVVVRQLRAGSRVTLVQIGSTRRRGLLEQASLRLSRALLDDGQGPIPRAFTLGMGMGLLPCMIPIWVLGLAAVTASPLAGVGLMLGLVAMTTPVLLVVTVLPRAVAKRRRERAYVPALLLGVSGVWLTLVGLAGLGVVSHVHVPLWLLGRSFTMMLW